MGTRHLIAIVKDNEYKIAQYGQWDGYPSGQGVEILEFLKLSLNYQLLFRGLNLAFIASEEQLNEIRTDPKIEKIGFRNLYPTISRDTGSDIFYHIQNANAPYPIKHYLDFAKDSLFCEWAYVVDFDKETFEIYEGYNKIPLSLDERFYSAVPNEDGYFPVRHVKTYSLPSLPTRDKFLEDLDSKC